MSFSEYLLHGMTSARVEICTTCKESKLPIRESIECLGTNALMWKSVMFLPMVASGNICGKHGGNGSSVKCQQIVVDVVLSQ